MVYILEDAQEAVKEISQDFHKDTVYTSAFFHSLILEQLGQATHSYMREGRHAEDIEEDIADVILCCLAYFNWLEEDASEAFERSLEKHREIVRKLKAEGAET